MLYPGELGEAYLNGESTQHLKIIDANYHGGQKAICTAKDTASCDGGLKPLDCKSYPFFPAPSQGDSIDRSLKARNARYRRSVLRNTLISCALLGMQ